MLLSMLFAAMLAPAAEERRPGGQPEAIVYRDAGYSGPAVAVGRANPDMGLAWPVRSIRVNSGTWQLCPQRNYGGRCITVSRSTSNLGNQLGPGSRLVSIRPIGAEPPRPVPNQSLRGMAAEFFPRPARDGRRVAACATGSATANCAARSADAFCRAQGWNGSKSEALESEGRAVYLADVLCVRSGY